MSVFALHRVLHLPFSSFFLHSDSLFTSICLSDFPSVCLSVWLIFFLSVCLSVYLSDFFSFYYHYYYFHYFSFFFYFSISISFTRLHRHLLLIPPLPHFIPLLHFQLLSSPDNFSFHTFQTVQHLPARNFKVPLCSNISPV